MQKPVKTDERNRRSSDGPPHRDAALRQLAAACQQVVAGKHAAREIAGWVRELGLSEAEFRLICLLQFDAPRPAGASRDQSTMAEQLALSPAQVSGMVERLSSAGFIELESRTTDRRRQLWRIALAGQLLISTVLAQVESQRRGAPDRNDAAREVA